MKIRDVMRNAPMVIEASDTIVNAQRWMTTYRIRHLPVVDNQRLVGLLSERDLLAARAGLGPDQKWWHLHVRDAMPAQLQTVGPEDSITEVEGRMAASKLDAFPVVEHGKLVGLVTVIDVLDADVRRAMGATPPPIAALGKPPTVSPDDSLLDAVRLMFDHHLHDLPVTDRAGKVVGMLSEIDVRRTIGDPTEYVRSPTPKRYEVQEVMDRDVALVATGQPMAEVAHFFADERLDAVPVVDDAGSLVGMVSYLEALHALACP